MNSFKLVPGEKITLWVDKPTIVIVFDDSDLPSLVDVINSDYESVQNL